MVGIVHHRDYHRSSSRLATTRTRERAANDDRYLMCWTIIWYLTILIHLFTEKPIKEIQ